MQPLRVHAAPYWHAGSCCARLLGMRAQRERARAESTRAVALETKFLVEAASDLGERGSGPSDLGATCRSSVLTRSHDDEDCGSRTARGLRLGLRAVGCHLARRVRRRSRGKRARAGPTGGREGARGATPRLRNSPFRAAGPGGGRARRLRDDLTARAPGARRPLALAPANPHPSPPCSVQMSAEAPADRRAVLSTIASVGALSALAPAAFADGAVSAATVARARGIYGARISALKVRPPPNLPGRPPAENRARGAARSSAPRANLTRALPSACAQEAAAKGDLGAFEAERGVFDIFASSGYARSAIDEKKAVKAGVNSIYAAVKAGDKAALKTSYDAFTKSFVPVDTNLQFGCDVGAVAPAAPALFSRRAAPRGANGPRVTASASLSPRAARALAALQRARRHEGPGLLERLRLEGAHLQGRHLPALKRPAPKSARGARGGCRRARSRCGERGASDCFERFGTRGGRAGAAFRARVLARGACGAVFVLIGLCPEFTIFVSASAAVCTAATSRSATGAKGPASQAPPPRGSRARAV